MDGEALSFPDNSFNKVVAMYVISVTQNPEKLIKEMKRVSVSNGDIYIVNQQLRKDNPLIKLFEKSMMLVKVCRWKPYFPSDFNDMPI